MWISIIIIINIPLILARRSIIDNCPRCGSYKVENHWNYDKCAPYTECYECGYKGPFENIELKYGDRTVLGIDTIENVKNHPKRHAIYSFSVLGAIIISVLIILYIIKYSVVDSYYISLLLVLFSLISIIILLSKSLTMFNKETGLHIKNIHGEIRPLKEHLKWWWKNRKSK